MKLELDELQQRLSAESKRSLLLVLQALDAAGKDGTIRSIFSGLNPAGVRVTSFKVPAGREAVQDYLWRVHAACPGRRRDRRVQPQPLRGRARRAGERASFRESVWKKRYRHINEFERMLSDEGTTIVKCFLNVSKEEQAQRFQERLDDPAKNWKFRAGDLDDRKLWPKFQDAYEDAHQQDVDLVRAVVRRAGRPQLGAKPGRRQDPVEDACRTSNPKFPDPEPGIEDIKIV